MPTTIKQCLTPTIKFELPEDVDTSLFQNIYFALRQRSVLIIRTGENIEVDGQNINVFLPQTETVKIRSGRASISLDWTYPNGLRGGTETEEIECEDNLIGRVLE
jgi:hypothetical protein